LVYEDLSLGNRPIGNDGKNQKMSRKWLTFGWAERMLAKRETLTLVK
jgi:hypothetical protein